MDFSWQESRFFHSEMQFVAVESVHVCVHTWMPYMSDQQPSGQHHDSVCVCACGCVDSLGRGRGQVFHGEGYGIMQNISASIHKALCVPSVCTRELWSCDLCEVGLSWESRCWRSQLVVPESTWLHLCWCLSVSVWLTVLTEKI